MAQSLTRTGKKLVAKVAFYQSVTLFLVTVITILGWGQLTSLSVLLGGICSLLPNLVFGLLAFKHAGASKNQLVVRSFSQGTKLKLALTMILFVVAFSWSELIAPALMVGFFLTLATQWLVFIFSGLAQQRGS